MQLFELEKIFEETSADDWEVISGGPSSCTVTSSPAARSIRLRSQVSKSTTP